MNFTGVPRLEGFGTDGLIFADFGVGHLPVHTHSN